MLSRRRARSAARPTRLVRLSSDVISASISATRLSSVFGHVDDVIIFLNHPVESDSNAKPLDSLAEAFCVF